MDSRHRCQSHTLTYINPTLNPSSSRGAVMTSCTFLFFICRLNSDGRIDTDIDIKILFVKYQLLVPILETYTFY